MPPALDDYLASRYLACALNFEYWLTTLFGDRYSLRGNVALALQFGDLVHGETSDRPLALPARINAYIREYESALPFEEFESERYKLSLLFVNVAVGKPVTSARVLPDDRAAAVEAGSNLFLPKPISPRALMAAVADALEHRTDRWPAASSP
jgi:hypothetical protein